MLGVGGVRALRGAGAEADRLAHQRGPRRVPGARAHAHAGAAGVSNVRRALEAVAANTVFTTHTPVPAGHDHFDPRHDLDAISRAMRRSSEIGREELLALGRVTDSARFQHDRAGDPRLALSQRRRPHPRQRLRAHLAPHVAAGGARREPLTYITNGVHVPTFLAQEWHEVFERYLGFGWAQRLTDGDFWQGIDDIPDQLFWSVRQSLKSQMLHLVRYRMAQQHFRNSGSEAHLDRLLKLRRPAATRTCSRSASRAASPLTSAPRLLFDDSSGCARSCRQRSAPGAVHFCRQGASGRSPGTGTHPPRARRSRRMPEFEGRMLMVEDYDMRLARRLVSGVRRLAQQPDLSAWRPPAPPA